jgi:hypothetical protein
MEFWIPRAANRALHGLGSPRRGDAPGGRRRVTVREVEAVTETKTKPVTVRRPASHKITPTSTASNSSSEPVSERVKADLKVAVYEGNLPVTNVETVTFDSISEKMDERKKWVPLVLQDRSYDKKTPFRLVSVRDRHRAAERAGRDR